MIKFLKQFKRMGLAAIAGLVLMLSILVASSAPAMAEVTPNGYCPGSSPSQISWTSGSFPWHTASWGRARVCTFQSSGVHYVEVLTEDTLTDGYCVHAEVDIATAWFYFDDSRMDGGTSTTSCGSAVYGWVAWYSTDILAVRLIRGTGNPGVGVNYMTIFSA